MFLRVFFLAITVICITQSKKRLQSKQVHLILKPSHHPQEFLNASSSGKDFEVLNLKIYLPRKSKRALGKSERKFEKNERRNYRFSGNYVPDRRDADLSAPADRVKEVVHKRSEERANDGEKENNEEERFYQDIYIHKKSPERIEYGHVLESPERAEQRYETNDGHSNRYQGKMIWRDKAGQFGEQHWDVGRQA